MKATTRRRVVTFSVAAVLAAGWVVGVTPSQSAQPTTHVKHELIVGFKTGTSEKTRSDVHQRRGGKVLKRFDSITADLVSVGNADEVAKKAEYQQEPAVRASSLNYIHATTATPNDPLFGSMWGLNNTGQNGGVADADIDAPEAWDLIDVAPSVVVADIDTGIDIDHPDLAGNIWTNPAPGPACSGSPPHPAPCNDLHGWDTANEDPTVFDPLQRSGDDFADRHGTHTAGTIGALGGNGIGVTGVAHTVQIMPVKFLNFGFGNDGDGIQSIEYARTHGAKVINASWGGGGFNQIMKDAIDRAGAEGIVFVAAAGNGARNIDPTPFYPASYASTNIITVAATNEIDTLASFSNYGPVSVDLAAPGNAVLSTFPRAPAGVVYNGQLVHLAFGVEGLSTAPARQDVIQRSLQYLSASGTVLVVDDDEGKTYETYYTDALSALGVAFDVVTVPSGGVGPNAATMAAHSATIWLTGDDNDQTFLAADQTQVTNLLAGGGKLLVSGQDIGHDLDITNTARTWYRSTLRAQAVSHNALASTLSGEAGGPFAGFSGSITGGDGANNQAFPSKVWPLNGATAALSYPPYRTMNGTSMATPHVAGAVALLRSLRPNATVQDLKSWIFNSVDQLPSLAGKVGTGGRLNLRRAVELAIGDTAPPTVGGSTVTAPNGGEALAGEAVHQITWNAASITDANLGPTPIRLESSSDGGTNWSLIANSLANTGSYSWQVPGIDSAAAMVRLTATDMLGNAASDTSDAAFVIDSIPPSFGSSTSTPGAFSPASGATSSLAVDVTESNPEAWTLTIKDAFGIAVRTTTGTGAFASFAWNGRDDAGAIVDDGTYSWSVEQRDRAGHAANSSEGSVVIDASAPVFGPPSSTPALFSPAAGGTSTLAMEVTEPDPGSWTLTIRDGAGTAVRTATGSGAFSSYTWNGRDHSGAIVPDGTYTWTVEQTDAFGNSATSEPGSVGVDSTAPAFGNPTSAPTTFSPSGGTSTLAVPVTEADPDSWTLTIRDGAGSTVRTATGTGSFASYTWNGRDGSGAIVPDGTYTWTVTQSDTAGNTGTSPAGSVAVDSTAPAFGTPSSTPATFSPADGTSTLAVSITEADPDSWTLIIRNSGGTAVRTATGTGAFSSYTWNGRDGSGAIVPDGTYTWTVAQSDTAGNTATSPVGSVTADSTTPSLTGLAATPFSFDPAAGGSTSIGFSLEEPSTVDVVILNSAGGVVRVLAQGVPMSSGPQAFSWNGRDDAGNLLPIARYQARVTATDVSGNVAAGTTAVEIFATDALRKGAWVGAFGSRGYILAAWIKANQKKPGQDLASLPASVASYTLDSGSRLFWAANSSDVRALKKPDGSRGNAAAFSSATQVKVTLNFSAANRTVLSLYLLDWDSTARRETITVTDADGSRSYPITASFRDGLWLRIPVSGTPQIPVVITATKTAGSTAVLSAIMFD